MPKKREPRDVNELAWSIVNDLTGDEPPAPEPDSERVEAGRKGGAKGGPARPKKLTPEQRSEIARKAARARWAKSAK
jgi:hypothetical protein